MIKILFSKLQQFGYRRFIVSVIGLCILGGSVAAMALMVSPFAILDVANGVLSGGAVVATAPGASSGRIVRFSNAGAASAAPASTPAQGSAAAASGASSAPAPASSAATPAPTQAPAAPAPTPDPAPASGGKPGSSNTGVPAGTQLTVVNGTQVFSTDNQVVSGLDIYGDVEIRAKNVTFKNSIVRSVPPPCTASYTHNEAALWVRADYGASAVIQDVEIVPTTPSPCLDGAWASNTTMLRVNIHNSNDGVKAFDNVTIQDSYIHDMVFFANDPNQGPTGGDGTHNDGVQTYEGNKHIILRHNTIATGAEANSAYQVTQDFGAVATDLHIENNWLDYGGCSLNFSHKGGPTPMTGIYIVGNRFGKHSFYNCPILISTQTVLSQNSDNVWDDTGLPIPAPQQHD
jgi:hypothetical protein